MQFNFAEIIQQQNALGATDNFAFAMARSAVVPGTYLFNSILPNQGRPQFYVKGSSMRIYATMLGQVPQDTPFPPMGAMTSESFFENTTKVGGSMDFPEAKLRELYEWANFEFRQIATTRGMGAATLAEKERLVNAVIGLAQMMLQAQWDTMEWAKSRAITKGILEWTFGKIPLVVDYNVPNENKQAYTGTNSFYNTASKFWTMIRWIYTRLSAGFQIGMNFNTWSSILENPVNNLVVTGDQAIATGITRKTFQYFDRTVTNYRATDNRESQSIIVYDKSASILTPAGELQPVQMVDDGDIFIVGEERPEGINLLEGGTPDPTRRYELGYNHVAPTVEGGAASIWSRVFTPQDKPYQLKAETASNFLPVIINPRRLLIVTTAMPS